MQRKGPVGALQRSGQRWTVGDVGREGSGHDACLGQSRHQGVELFLVARDQADLEAVAAEDLGDRDSQSRTRSNDDDRGIGVGYLRVAIKKVGWSAGLGN
jgi:hypothetical protein